MPNSEPLAFGAFAGLWCGALPPPLLTLAALATGAEEPPAGALSFSKPHSCGCGALLTLRVAGLRESFALVVFGFGTAVFAGVAVGVRVAAAKTVGTGVHRFDFDGRYAYLSPTVEGYVGNIMMIMDLKEPARPAEVGA